MIIAISSLKNVTSVFNRVMNIIGCKGEYLICSAKQTLRTVTVKIVYNNSCLKLFNANILDVIL